MSKSKSGKSPEKSDEVGFTLKNAILSVLRARILEFLPIGLGKIWFRIGGDDEYLLAGALGFSADDYDSILRFGEFVTPNFMLKTKKLQPMIGIEIERRELRKHEFFIRFTRDIFGPASTDAEAAASTPDDDFQSEYIAQYVTHPKSPCRPRLDFLNALPSLCI